jgi:hypothetical protein
VTGCREVVRTPERSVVVLPAAVVLDDVPVAVAAELLVATTGGRSGASALKRCALA